MTEMNTKLPCWSVSKCCSLVSDSTEHEESFQNELKFDILSFLFPLLWYLSRRQIMLFRGCSLLVL